MTKKKIVVCLLALALISMQLFALSACQKVEYDPNNFIDDVSSEKIVKEKITLNFFVPRSQQHLQDWNQMRLFQELEEETNVHINFIYGDVSSYENQKSK